MRQLIYTMEQTTSTAPAYWASYVINGDSSGMEDKEIAACDAWLATLAGWYCVGCDDESEIRRYNDATGFILCDVLTYHFLRNTSANHLQS